MEVLTDSEKLKIALEIMDKSALDVFYAECERIEGSEITFFKVLCPCQTDLEIDEGTTKICPNCGRELDDRGAVQ